ncbi:MAG TPA: AI-2E family transporter [Puia sp.]|jgi:predicted PurR-regulated permease PerM|nr:AI-2E family transporter [Puia sp.]
MEADELLKKKPVPAIRLVVQMALQLLMLALLLGWSYHILFPFVTPIVWGAVLAVALYPIHQRLKVALKGKGGFAAVIICICMLALVILPAVILMLNTADEAREAMTAFQEGKLKIPPPGDNVKNWPLVGRKADAVWRQASDNFSLLVEKNPEKVKSVARKVVGLVGSTATGIGLFAVAVIIMAVFLSYSTKASNFARSLFSRLMNSSTFDMPAIAATTIRNVVKGILGVAFIQTLLFAAGLWLADIPYAGIWTLCCLVLAIVQLGTLPIAVGVIVYIWGQDNTLAAILLTIWVVIVSLLDNVLKPILMGKGAPVPMLVVFLGALGGFMYMGFIGLFIGAVILSLGYKLFEVWLAGTEI